jgi:hypothetical protein
VNHKRYSGSIGRNASSWSAAGRKRALGTPAPMLVRNDGVDGPR